MTDHPTPKNCPCCGAKTERACWGHYHGTNVLDWEKCPLREVELFTADQITAWNRRVADEELALRAAEIALEATRAELAKETKPSLDTKLDQVLTKLSALENQVRQINEFLVAHYGGCTIPSPGDQKK